jgi:hypothetical protein
MTRQHLAIILNGHLITADTVVVVSGARLIEARVVLPDKVSDADAPCDLIKVCVDQFDRLAQYVFHGIIPHLGYEHTRQRSPVSGATRKTSLPQVLPECI